MRPLRIVFYAVNGSGLGHVTRLIAIARWVRRLETLISGVPPEILFLTSTEATSLLSDHRFAAFKLPSKGTARHTGLEVLEHRRLAKHFVWQMLATMHPDILVVDTFPQGSFDELMPVLDGPFSKVLVLRAVKPEYGSRPVFQASTRLYDRIILPHAPGTEPALAGILPPDRPTAWVGDILNIERSETRPEHVLALRKSLGLDSERLVYVSAGGGGDPTTESTLALIVSSLAHRPDLHLLVGAGPLYRGARLHGPRLTWFERADVSRYFPACDAAIAAAGYNTFHELLHLGIPSAFYPQDKIADAQDKRLAAALAAGAALALPKPSELSPETLVATLDGLLENRDIAARARAFVPDNGARIAAAHVLMAKSRSKANLTPLRAAELLTPTLVSALESLGDHGDALLRSGLGQLFPDGELDRLEERRAIESLLPSLSFAARAEVHHALERRLEGDGLKTLERGLTALCEAAGPHAAILPGLVETMLKKHLPSDETSHQRWVEALLEAARQLLVQGPLTALDRVTLYRIFPRLLDTSIADTFALFSRLLDSLHPLGVPEISRRLQVLKLGQRRPEPSHIEALLVGARP